MPPRSPRPATSAKTSRTSYCRSCRTPTTTSSDANAASFTSTRSPRSHVRATVGELDEEALGRILTEPKNALVRQYQKLFDMENVHLKFTQGALRAISREALKRKSGARGLRAIMEAIMVDLMYEIPSQPNIKEVLISEEVVTQKEQPLLVYQKTAETA